MPRRANLPCACGSGRPYKRCHRNLERGFVNFLERAREGDVDFFAHVRSEDEQPLSMTIDRVKVNIGCEERMLVSDPITISTNCTYDKGVGNAAAAISMPFLANVGAVHTTGNASVVGKDRPIALSLKGGVKKLRADSKSGGFGTVMIKLQWDTQQQYIDVYFGRKGQAEVLNEAGKKNRPHLALYPDGNGKYFWSGGFNCEIEIESTITGLDSFVSPSKLKIKAKEFSEVLEIEFCSLGQHEVEIVGVRFD